MHTRRMVAMVLALCALFVSVWMLPDAAASEEPREPAQPLAEMTLGASRIDWLPVDASEPLVLTVAGPAGIWVRKEFPAGQPASLSLSDPEWEHLPDGTYTWELRVVSPPGTPERSLVESGHFFVNDGSLVPAGKKASATPQRTPRLITAESYIGDGLSVTGNVCIGTSCTNDDPDPNLPSLILKAPQPHIRFDDQFVEGGSTPHDWAVFINPVSAAEFSIADVENGLIPFTIAGGAPNSSLYVASSGFLGLKTATPGAPLHLYTNATNNIHIGMGPSPTSGPAFNVGYGGSTYGRGAGYLNVRPDASATAPNPSLRFLTANVERMIVTNTGSVGIGTTSPSAQLHVRDTGSGGKILAENASGTAASREMLEIKNNGAAAFILKNVAVEQRWAITAFESSLIQDNQANAGFELTLGPTGNLTIAGSLTQGSDRNTKTDVVSVQPEEVLARLVSLPISMWSRKDDDSRVRHLGPMAQDFSAAFGLGEDNRHIAPLDMAGVSMASVQALHGMMAKAIAEKDAEITELRQRLAALEELVSKLAPPQQP